MSSQKNRTPILVAHRGDMQRYPENTLLGIEKAFAVGAQWVEFDVQLSADGVPFLLHDSDLQRTAGIEGSTLDLQWQQLASIEVNEGDRFGNGFQGNQIPALQDVVELLSEWPARQVFVELKRASLRHFGINMVIEEVIDVLKPVLSRCTLISFDRLAVQVARERADVEIGWVVESWDETVRQKVEDLQPDFLFCNYKRLPDDVLLWPGNWRWVLYDIKTADHAMALARRGVQMIETGTISELMGDPRFSKGSSID